MAHKHGHQDTNSILTTDDSYPTRVQANTHCLRTWAWWYHPGVFCHSHFDTRRARPRLRYTNQNYPLKISREHRPPLYLSLSLRSVLVRGTWIQPYQRTPVCTSNIDDVHACAVVLVRNVYVRGWSRRPLLHPLLHWPRLQWRRKQWLCRDRWGFVDSGCDGARAAVSLDSIDEPFLVAEKTINYGKHLNEQKS